MNSNTSVTDMDNHIADKSSPDTNTSLLEWTDFRGKNQVKEICLRPGLKLIHHHLAFPEDSPAGFDIDRSPLFFCFSLSGKSRSTVTHGTKKQTVIQARKEISSLSYFPKSKGFSECSPEKPLQMIHVMVEPALLNTLMEGQFDALPLDFRRVAEGRSETPFYRTGTRTGVMQAALHQMLTCPFQGLTRRIFLESKSLELVALQLEQSVFNKNNGARPSALQPSDIDRIHDAMSIIVSNLQHPLPLTALARQVGLNDFKLKIGFRHVCGKTAFGFLHDHRMERARQCLEQRLMNVKEVAHEVGYMDPGRFSDAFKNYFGVRPSFYRRN